MRRASLGVLIAFLVLGFVILPMACRPDEKKEDAAQQAGGDCTDKVINPNVDPPDNQFGLNEVTVDKFAGMNTAEPVTDRNLLRGRIVWNLWTGDSWKMWDFLARHGFGTSDLLKTLDSRNRSQRFQRIGTINQPGFMPATKPDQYGLWLDVPRPGDPDGQFDNGIDPKTYGRSSGVIGLRIYDNPAFNAAAKAEWMKHVGPNGVNNDYYTNERYYTNPNLVRPYVVGMACAFCHVSFDPTRPPADVNEPKYTNLNDYVGAQYLKVYEVFMPRLEEQPVDHFKDSFVWQLLYTNPPGTLDTSFIATDYINNPGTMNGVFNVTQRLAAVDPKINPSATEKLAGGALNLRAVTNCMPVPRVLKQGDDSVGFQAALSRVYVNIGESWDEWSKHFRPLVGGPRLGSLHGQTPVEVKTLQAHSNDWNWSEQRAQYLAQYLITYGKPLLLANAPGGDRYLTKDQAQLDRGKRVFAENCAACHSSKQPPPNVNPLSEQGKQWFVAAINDPNINLFQDNFYGDERRYSAAQIGTNASRAAATNAMRGHIWDNFSSETYKTLPQIEPITVKHPLDNSDVTFRIQGGGPGYYRPPSLISLWSSAPFLHNNTVGPREPADPSVEGRMKAFNESIDELLLLNVKERKPLVWKTTAASYIRIPQSYAPEVLQKLIVDPRLKDANGNYQIGPIPQNMPVNLLSNVNLGGNERDLVRLGLSITAALIEIRLKNLQGEAATARLRETVPHLMKVNSVPDFVVNRGHMYGTQLPREDKLALIELLKTF
jgi:mono/diheme cytochrome c family protein